MGSSMTLKCDIPADIAAEIKKACNSKTCKRCKGFMITELPQLTFGVDSYDGGLLEGIRRCISCGDKIDPVVLLNRYYSAINKRPKEFSRK